MTPAIGTIGVISGELARYAAFNQCLLALDKPAGAVAKWLSGSCDIAGNRNRLVRDFEGDWLWMLDDDHVFAPDTLTRLLAHFDNPSVDVVVPYCVSRRYPFKPVLYGFDERGLPKHLEIKAGPSAGLMPVYGVGAAGMLIRRSVFERVPAPWFEIGYLDSRSIGEDLTFCWKAKAAGVRVFVDFSVQIGHITTAAVWPAPGRGGFRLQWLFNGTKGADAATQMSRGAEADPLKA